MYEKGPQFIFDADAERRLIGDDSWPISYAGGLIVRAEQARERVMARDPSEYPAGAARNKIIAEQFSDLGVLDKIISQATPHAPSVADGAARFLETA